MRKVILTGLLLFSMILAQAQCPVKAKRNNGNGNGCQSWLELIFAEQPSTTVIDSVYVNGVKIPLPVYSGQRNHGQTYQLIYCTDQNYPAVSHYRIWFHNLLLPCDVVTGGPLAVKVKDFSAKRLNNKEIKVSLTVTESDGELIKVKLSYDGVNWFDRALFIPKGAGTYTLTIKR